MSDKQEGPSLGDFSEGDLVEVLDSRSAPDPRLTSGRVVKISASWPGLVGVAFDGEHPVWFRPSELRPIKPDTMNQSCSSVSRPDRRVSC